MVKPVLKIFCNEILIVAPYERKWINSMLEPQYKPRDRDIENAPKIFLNFLYKRGLLEDFIFECYRQGCLSPKYRTLKNYLESLKQKSKYIVCAFSWCDAQVRKRDWVYINSDWEDTANKLHLY